MLDIGKPPSTTLFTQSNTLGGLDFALGANLVRKPRSLAMWAEELMLLAVHYTIYFILLLSTVSLRLLGAVMLRGLPPDHVAWER